MSKNPVGNEQIDSSLTGELPVLSEAAIIEAGGDRAISVPPVRRGMTIRWKKEGVLAFVLLGAGLLVLPMAIYFVGQQIVGDYEAEGGLLHLAIAIWGGLRRGEVSSWILVLSPYLVIQLVRIAGLIWRSRKPVNSVTV